MKIILSSRKHHYLKRVSIFLIAVALIAGMAGCARPQYDLSILSTAGGSVRDPGEGIFIDYDLGTVVDLEAIPDSADYDFINWTGDVDNIADVNDATTTITMRGDYTIYANFLITIHIDAEVETVYDPDNILGGLISVGDIIEGTYIYNPAITDSNALPTVGDYRHTSSHCGILLTADNFVFQTDPSDVDFLVQITNDHGTPKSDNYLLRSYNNIPLYTGELVEHIAWQLDDPNCTALSSEDLPTTPPILTQWESNVGLTIEGHDPATGDDYFIRAHVFNAELINYVGWS